MNNQQNQFTDKLIDFLQENNVSNFAINIMIEADNGKSEVHTLLGGEKKSIATSLAVELAKDAIEAIQDEECDCDSCLAKRKQQKRKPASEKEIRDFIKAKLQDIFNE